MFLPLQVMMLMYLKKLLTCQLGYISKVKLDGLDNTWRRIKKLIMYTMNKQAWNQFKLNHFISQLRCKRALAIMWIYPVVLCHSKCSVYCKDPHCKENTGSHQACFLYRKALNLTVKRFSPLYMKWCKVK